jgi:hypothetical protein
MAAISGHSGAGIPDYWEVGSDGGIFTFVAFRTFPAPRHMLT